MVAIGTTNDRKEVIVVEETPNISLSSDKVNPGIDTSKLQVPATGVTTRSKGRLKLDNGSIDLDDIIQSFTRSKKLP